MTQIKACHRARLGFNLIEIAIIMAVIGLVLGGIFVAAANVYENRNIGRSIEQATQIVTSMRSLFDNQTLDPACINWCDCDVTPMVMNAGYLPADMMHGTDTSQAFNLWGGNFQVCTTSWMISAPFRGVFINFHPIPRSACIKLLSRLMSKQTDDIAYYQVNATGFYMPPYGSGTVPTIAEATNYCNSSTSNVLQFVYKF